MCIYAIVSLIVVATWLYIFGRYVRILYKTDADLQRQLDDLKRRLEELERKQ